MSVMVTDETQLGSLQPLFLKELDYFTLTLVKQLNIFYHRK